MENACTRLKKKFESHYSSQCFYVFVTLKEILWWFYDLSKKCIIDQLIQLQQELWKAEVMNWLKN